MKTNTVSKALKVTKAKTQLYTHSTVFYVSSESNPEEQPRRATQKSNREEKYIVVKTPKGTFCQCVDFITRRLPLYGTPAFTHCKHILAVNTLPVKSPVTRNRKFGVFYATNISQSFRSIDVPGTFPSRAAADRAITSFTNTKYRVKRDDYEIRPV